MPNRGLRSFQFVTRPTQFALRLFLPSGQVLYVTAWLKVPAGSVSGSTELMNQSQRRPALIVARLIVHLSWTKTPLSFLIELLRSVGMRSVTLTGLMLPFGSSPLKVTGWMSRVYCCCSRHLAWLIVAPRRGGCEPVTYDAANCSVNSFEKWSAGLFHAAAFTFVD